jgi:hypothetical protein
MATFKLSEKTTLNVVVNKYGKVVAEIVRDREHGVRRLYLHEKEVNAMLMLIPQINRTTRSDEEGDISVQLSGDKYVTVSLFRGQKYVGVHTYKDGQRVLGRCMNMSIDEWDKLVSKRKQIADALKATLKGVKEDCDVEAVSIMQYQWAIVMKDGSGVAREAEQWFFEEKTCKADVEEYDVTPQQQVSVIYVSNSSHLTQHSYACSTACYL